MAERTHSRLTKKGRVYTDPVTGEEYLSVTSIINSAHPFDGTNWASYLVAGTAVDEWDKVSSLYALDPESARKYLGSVTSRYSSNRADIGTAVHACLEAHFKGYPLPLEERDMEFGYGRKLSKENWEEVEQIWSQLLNIVLRIELKPWKAEPLIVSREHSYAGSADIIAESNQWEGLRVVDLKTKAKRDKPRPEISQQLAAYANGDVVLNDDGTETPLAEVDKKQGMAIVASKVAAELFTVDLNFTAFHCSTILSEFYRETGGIEPVQLLATDTPEEVHQQIQAATSYPQLQALYYRHAGRGKWDATHTVAAATQRIALSKKGNTK